MIKIYSSVPRSSKARPTAYIVMGKASHNTAIIDVLKKESELIEHETIDQATAHKQNILINTSDLNTKALQHQIDALAKQGYEIELHWSDLDIQSNRNEKITYQTLARKNYNKIKTHRWSMHDETVQQDDQQLISSCFKQLIEDRQSLRKEALKMLDSRDSNQKEMDHHHNRMQALLTAPPKTRSSQAMLLAIVSDISNYPELYLDEPQKLDDFYTLLDRSDCHVYYTSIQRNLPVKSHGCVAIGSPNLAEGIVFSAAGDIRRGKLYLPKDFQLRLIQALEKESTLPTQVIRQFGSQASIIKDLKSREYFDSQAIRQLLIDCNLKTLTDEYINKIQFNSKYKYGFELWNKPRSGQQYVDRSRFNQQFPVFLTDEVQSNITRKLSQLHHGITRNTAIREQQVPCSQLIKRWLALSAHQQKVDAHRKIIYKEKSSVWQFESLALSPQTGNCNTITTHLLGKKPITASMTNIGANKGMLIDKDIYGENPKKNRANEIIHLFFTYLERVQASFLNDEALALFIEEIETLNEAFLKGVIDLPTYIKFSQETLEDHKYQLNHIVSGHTRTIFEYISELFQSLFTLLNVFASKNHKPSAFRPNQNLKSAIDTFKLALEDLARDIEHDTSPKPGNNDNKI